MKYRYLLLLASVVAAVGCIIAQAQSGRVYEDKDSRFKITLVGDWRVVNYSDAVGRKKTEFVYRDRSEGLLRISSDTLGSRSLADIAHEEEESMRLYRPGFELISKEAFGGGQLRGVRLSYYYLEGGRRMTCTVYYLEDGKQVWELQFTGKRGVLDLIRNVTDEMARSFQTT